MGPGSDQVLSPQLHRQKEACLPPKTMAGSIALNCLLDSYSFSLAKSELRFTHGFPVSVDKQPVSVSTHQKPPWALFTHSPTTVPFYLC